MSRIYLALISLFLAFYSEAYADSPECKVAEQALKEASSIRKLDIKQAVPCVIQNKKEVETYLLSIVNEQLPPEKLAYEELIYKKIGLFPPGFDYKKGIVELYLSQIGGYYDPQKDQFIMAGWVPGSMQEGIAVHELTHALQDQHYDLKEFIDPKTQNGDMVLARSALVEGDASAVMYDYERVKRKQRPLKAESNINDILLANLAGSAVGSAQVPKSLQMILIFPYTAGLNFVHSIIKSSGYEALAKVYERPPLTSEEIIHPDKYLSNKKDFVDIDEKELRGSIDEKFKLVYQDTIGEFGITALLSMFPVSQSEIKVAAEGWGGDRIGLFVDEKARQKILIWITVWDSLADIKQFEDIYLKSLMPHLKDTEHEITRAGQTLTLKLRI